MTYTFEAERRDDGSFHLKNSDLPGFHFIIGPDEKPTDFEEALIAAIRTHLDAMAKQRAGQKAAPIRIRERRVFELEVA
jgi:hypothetical protein